MATYDATAAAGGMGYTAMYNAMWMQPTSTELPQHPGLCQYDVVTQKAPDGSLGINVGSATQPVEGAMFASRYFESYCVCADP